MIEKGGMNQSAVLLVGFVLPFIVMVVVMGIVSSRVRRSPVTAAWKATREGVLFIVGLRRWQRVLVLTFGIAVIVIGCVLFLAALTSTNGGSTLGTGIAGVGMTIGGVLLVWLAHGMARLRLEVIADTVWVFRMTGAPREVALNDVAALAPLVSNNFGGVVARSETGRLFYATRVMLGYPQLIDYFRGRRPDLSIPDTSWPL